MYRNFIEALADSRSMSEVCDVCKTVCSFYGFEHFSYSTRIPVSLVSPHYLVIESSANSTRTIVEHQSSMSYVRQYVRTSTPIYWHKRHLLPRERQAASNILDEAASQGYPNGISLPIHSHHGGSAMINYSSLRADETINEEIERIIPELHLLAAYKHEAISKYINYDEYDVNVSKISNRERECLIWSAEGVTTTGIAKNMGITDSTVTFHLQNAMHKLTASNCKQAVARAIMFGVI